MYKFPALWNFSDGRHFISFHFPAAIKQQLSALNEIGEKPEEGMDDHDATSRHVDPSRPAMGFPLGTALLIIVIFCLSGCFSCCYHWDKLRALWNALWPPSDGETDTIQAPSKSTPPHLNSNKDQRQSLPVIMPGDKIPKYMAWPCPCEAPPQLPLPQEKIAIEVQVPPPPS